MIRTDEQYDALYREFRLLLEGDPSHRSSVPGRLLALIDELGPRSPSLGGGTAQRQWTDALARGDDYVDLEAVMPRSAGPTVARYDRLLDEADEYCRRAELLTVAPSREAVLVRKWAFGEVTRQCDGAEPRPWPG